MVEQDLVASEARVITLEEEIKDAARELATLRAKDTQFTAMVTDARDSAKGTNFVVVLARCGVVWDV